MENTKNLKTSIRCSDLSLNLIVREVDVLKYLTQYESPQREEKALEALKVGVIAILSASPSLDTKVVEEKFSAIEMKLEGYTNEFKTSLEEDLKKYFEKEKGDIPLTLNSFFGERGILSTKLREYFDENNGRVNLLLKNELGPGSAFTISLDPNNKESVISRIERKVEDKLLATTGDLIDQFSLDKDTSGMSRVKKIFEDKIQEIKTANEVFFSQLRSHLGMQETRTEEAEKGTQKGRDFQSNLYERIVLLSQQLQDSTEDVTGTPGEISRSKVGDYVVTLGDTSGAPSKRIVIEAKKEKNYKLRDAIEELKVAKENRNADCGIFVFAKGYEPIEAGDFKIIGNDFLCTADEEYFDQEKPILFLEAAYKIARINIIGQVRQEAKDEIDISAVKSKIEKIHSNIELISDILTKAKTIQNSGETIEKTASKIRDDLELTIRETMDLLR